MREHHAVKPAEGRDTYGLRELAYVLGISAYAARKLVHQPGFPATKVLGRILVPRISLAEWLKTRANEGLEKKI